VGSGVGAVLNNDFVDNFPDFFPDFLVIFRDFMSIRPYEVTTFTWSVSAPDWLV